MKREVRTISEDGKMVQITLVDERWYVNDKQFVPSTTWITRYYPKGIQFFKWLADKGWDEAEAIKTAAGDKGSKVHFAIQDMILGKEIKMDAKYLNKTSGEMEELSLEEYEALYWFSKFWESVKPETIANELTLFAPHEKNCPNALLNPSDVVTPCTCIAYAGTIDWIGKIDGEVWLIDFKTGQTIWKEYELQISAYKHLLEVNNMDLPQHLGILQVPYYKNKNNKWKLTEIKDKFPLFANTYQTWKEEAGDQIPLQKDLPTSLQLVSGLIEVDKPKKKKKDE